MNIAVVAGGWSAKRINLEGLHERMYVIGVNDAALYMRTNCVVTMDRLWLENRYEELLRRGITTYYRAGTAKSVDPTPPQFIKYECNNSMDEMMSEKVGVLNGNNSGVVAVNLAYQMLMPLKSEKRFPSVRLFLIGFDFARGPNDERHWYPDYPWGGGTKPGKLKEWSASTGPWTAQMMLKSIEVVQVGEPPARFRGARIMAPTEFELHRGW